MIDRAVEHPNRYRLVPVPGEDDYIMDLIPEPGEVLEEGTPLCKATLLQDATATKLGFAKSDDPTVDQAFDRVSSQLGGLSGRIGQTEEYIAGAPRLRETTFQKLMTGRFI